MYAAFVKFLNMSAAAGILIALVCLLRLVMKRVPKKYICLLWGIVALRLICPVSISSPVSVFNYIGHPSQSSGQIAYIQYNGKSEKPMGELPGLGTNTVAADSTAVTEQSPNFYLPTAMGIWATGMAAMVLYTVLGYWRVRMQVREAIPLDRRNIFICDGISTPFILGIMSPGIYLPSSLNAEQQRSVIAHERAHIARLDHWWKPIGFLLLGVHWFNPLVWVAYALLCRDIEMACDEKVIFKMTPEQKQTYSTVLLTCSMPRKAITACPLAFGETGVKHRIKGILNYRKPTAWIAAASLTVCLCVAVLFLTDPVKAKASDESLAVSYGDLSFTLPQLFHCDDNSDITYDGRVVGGMKRYSMELGQLLSGMGWIRTLGFSEWEMENIRVNAGGSDGGPYFIEFLSDVPQGEDLTLHNIHNLFYYEGSLYDLWLDALKVDSDTRNQILSTVHLGSTTPSSTIGKTDANINTQYRTFYYPIDTACNLYSSPGAGARVVGILSAQERFLVLREENIANVRWAYGTSQDQNILGWLKLDESSLISYAAQTEAAQEIPTIVSGSTDAKTPLEEETGADIIKAAMASNQITCGICGGTVAWNLDRTVTTSDTHPYFTYDSEGKWAEQECTFFVTTNYEKYVCTSCGTQLVENSVIASEVHQDCGA